mmetsp:Transcript_49388/g.89392  ORF Transcript_49388/g.89392 Transcript_49388/m.89392 type:complete len:231 (-) Transcript_49388:832-1524(-)
MSLPVQIQPLEDAHRPRDRSLQRPAANFVCAQPMLCGCGPIAPAHGAQPHPTALMEPHLVHATDAVGPARHRSSQQRPRQAWPRQELEVMLLASASCHQARASLAAPSALSLRVPRASLARAAAGPTTLAMAPSSLWSRLPPLLSPNLQQWCQRNSLVPQRRHCACPGQSVSRTGQLASPFHLVECSETCREHVPSVTGVLHCTAREWDRSFRSRSYRPNQAMTDFRKRA